MPLGVSAAGRGVAPVTARGAFASGSVVGVSGRPPIARESLGAEGRAALAPVVTVPTGAAIVADGRTTEGVRGAVAAVAAGAEGFTSDGRMGAEGRAGAGVETAAGLVAEVGFDGAGGVAGLGDCVGVLGFAGVLGFVGVLGFAGAAGFSIAGRAGEGAGFAADGGVTVSGAPPSVGRR